MSSTKYVLILTRVKPDTKPNFESKKMILGCDICKAHIQFKSRRQLMYHLNHVHKHEISKKRYDKIRSIVRNIESGIKEGVYIP